jgi:hypothetical protein
MTCACPRGWCYQRTDCRKIDPVAKTPREWRMGCVAERLRWLRQREYDLNLEIADDPDPPPAKLVALVFIEAAIARLAPQP